MLACLLEHPVFFLILFLFLTLGIIFCLPLASTDPSFFKRTKTNVVCALDIKITTFQQRALLPFKFSRVIYIHLAKSKAHVYKYYSCCIFDGLCFQRTSSFSGVKGKLDLHFVPSETVCFQTLFRVNEENIEIQVQNMET